MNEPLIVSSSFDADHCSLIVLVKYNPVLYDTTHFLYGDGEANRRAWTKIAEKLGKDEEWCQSTWESLKSCYSERMNMSKEERKEWPYDTALTFLDPFVGLSSSEKLIGIGAGSWEGEGGSGSSRSQLTFLRIPLVQGIEKVTSKMAACCTLI